MIPPPIEPSEIEVGWEGYDRDIKYFGPQPFVWAKVGGLRVVYHMTTVAEREDMLIYLSQHPEVTEQQARAAYAVRSINSEPLDENLCIADRIALFQKWPQLHLDLLAIGYQRACKNVAGKAGRG